MLPDPVDRELPRPVRAAAFALLLSLLAIGPCARQLLGVESEWLRPWEMFQHTAVGLAEVRFEQRQPDGSVAKIDRYQVLGYASPHDAPESVRRIEGQEGVWQVARQLCDALGAGSDVRAFSRIASLGGWEPGDAGERNLCVAAAPADRAPSEARAR